MDTGLLILRLVVGLTLAAHGIHKLSGWFNGSGVASTAAAFESLGYRPGKLFVIISGLGETVGGLFLVIGVLTPLAAAAILSDMAAAAMSAHLNNGFWSHNNGYEHPLALGFVAAGLAFTGPGNYSLDHLLGWNLAGVWWGELALALAIAASIAIETYRRQNLPATVTNS